MTNVKQKFLKVAHYMWSADDNLFDANEIEAMLEAWLVVQLVRTQNASDRLYINTILDSENFSNFNEMCNHNGLRLTQVETYFDEVYTTESEREENSRESRMIREQQYL